MQLQTIHQISRTFDLSTRTLRYYEQIGLIASEKTAGYAYRVYTEDTVRRLEQILVLRKLRIPLKQIALILQSEDIDEIIDAFQRNLARVEDEIAALSTIRDIINGFVQRLNDSIAQRGGPIKTDWMDDAAILEAVDGLSVHRASIQTDKTIADLQQADSQLRQQSSRHIRIVYLPPAVVASMRCAGPDPELRANQAIDEFVRAVGLDNVKPDLRHYGFNSPEADGTHGYEVWVTIPKDMAVPAPLCKKHFEGGLYAAYMIPMGRFEEWNVLNAWLADNDTYRMNSGTKGAACMFGALEEHINYRSHIWLENTEPADMQLDLLMPIQPRDDALDK